MMNSDIRLILLESLKKVLRPLVRILLKYQISYGEFAHLLRNVYVEIADKDYSPDNKKKRSITKISVMTGIDRKIVQKILRMDHKNQSNSDGDKLELKNSKIPKNKGVRIVEKWISTPNYLDNKGNPIDIPIKGELSFESLVRESGIDNSPRSILNELIRIGIVTEIDKKIVRLLQNSYIPSKSEAHLINILLQSTADLLITGQYNICEESEYKRFQRYTTYKNIPESVMIEFTKISNQASKQLLDKISRWLLTKKISVKSRGEKKRRVGVGIYYIETNNDGE